MKALEKKIVVGPFQCNCRLLVCPETGKAILIDPGDEADRIVEELKRVQTPNGSPLQVEKLFHTHAHLDHIGATRGVAEALQSQNAENKTISRAEIVLHREDLDLYLNLKKQGELFGFQYQNPLEVDHFVVDEEEFQIGSLRFQVLHTPGHSPGSVSLSLKEDSGLGVQETLFSGDTLFKGSVGRTDLWGADQDTMFRSIQNRLLTLDDDTRVCAGHGPDSTIGLERFENPFLSQFKK